MIKRRAGLLAAFLVTLFAAVPALAAKKFEGQWTVSVTIPVSPASSTKRTFTINLNAAPRGDSLHGRITIVDDQGRTVGGVYRQNGKKVSVTYELPCDGDGDSSCASLVLLGKVKNNSKFRGQVVVMWDSSNAQNPALFDTSNGNFSGDRVQ